MPAPAVLNRTRSASPTPTATPAPANAATQKSMPSIPFTRAARLKSAIGFQTSGQLQNLSSQVINPFQLPPAGFLRYVDMIFTVTSVGNAANVAFAADAPFSLVNQIQLTNSAGDTIIAPISGYGLYLINKYGAHASDPWDPRALPTYAVTTGAVAAGGSFQFQLRLPIELDTRDAFCALPNLAANKAYQLTITLAASASAGQLYTTTPTTAPTYAINGTMYFWSRPNSSNDAGVNQETMPYGAGSVSQIRYQNPLVANTVQLTNVGNTIRYAIFVLRTAAGVRTQADWPAVSQIILNNDPLFYKTLLQWQADMAFAFSNSWYHGPVAFDTAGGLDTGVFVLTDFMINRGSINADGPRDQYLVTLDATLLQLVAQPGFGVAGGQDKLDIYTNEIKPTSAAALYSPNLT